MSTTLHPFERNTANAFQPPPSALLIRRQISNALLVVLSTFFALFAVGVLFYLILYILRQGIPYLNLDFFTKPPAPNGEPGGGMGPAVQGTLILVGLAALLGVPLGLFTAIFLAELGADSGSPADLLGSVGWGGPGHHHDPDRGTNFGGCAAPRP